MAKRIAWTDKARADMRAIDRETAMGLLHGLSRFITTEQGDLKQLRGTDPPELRLRLGDYRIRLYDHGDVIEILSVNDRRQSYR